MEAVPQQLHPRILYVSALIETTDSLIAFEKTELLSFDAGRFQLIGCRIDENYIAGQLIDYTACIKMK